MWFVYILQCSDSTFYTGITCDLDRRIKEHNTSNTVGAKYTRVRRPVYLLYKEEAPTRALAGKRERAIKKLTRLAKEKLIQESSLDCTGSI